jgi:DNA-binding response OmpR family regulator
MKLLVVDSDCDLVEMLSGWLKALGHEVYRAYTGERARILWGEQQPELVILDAALKDMDAREMARDMQSKQDALLLILSDRRDVHDEIRYLQAGADDYLHKPFFPAQLLARIYAVSRRSRFTLERRPSSIISVGSICVDSLHNEVSVDGKTTHLTPTESKLLHLLAINANDVCTADQIVTHVWGYDGEGDTCLIKAHIRHLRQKVEADASHPQYILTVPGVGYMLVRRAAEENEMEEITRPLHTVSM